ncbi:MULTISPECIES: glycosyltransferase family 4 protein [unclassified Bradyrhizobium]|uniref:glycosyltransferase family 4 protein n=1 Tax=unclassified Bradyrhizobium TaxID=2631580 RepID=UPI0020124ADC|nr:MULTISPECIES: glycosyltransferase family 4 protein [unclassified Bradyrhizobium]
MGKESRGEPLRVLQILHTDERGGIETLASAIAAGLAARGVEVDTVFLFSRPDAGFVGKIAGALTMAWRLLRDDHDAIVAYQATASLLVGLCGALRGCRRRIVHQTAVPAATAWPLRLADKIAGSLGLYTANVANTAATRKQFDGYPASYRRRLVLIEHGLVHRAPWRTREETRRLFALPEDAPLLLNVGRMAPQKNQAVVIAALAEVDGAAFVVAGQGSERDAYEAQAERLGVADRLHLLGAVAPAEIANLYAACDAFVFPTVWETFGLAAAEAAMSGIPMAVSDIAVLREVLSATTAPVIFVPPDDLKGWAAAIRQLLATPPPRHVLNAFAQEVATRYSVERMIDSYIELLNDRREP